MSNKSPGVVVVTTFCGPNQKYFAGFISYMDRPEAVRRKYIEEYDIFAGYMDYMGNPDKSLGMDFEKPEKISGLFTAQKDTLSEDEIQSLKTVYTDAQDKGSLMWQTVLSFDNDWLAQMGVYDSTLQILDEKRMRNVARSAINKMLEKEGLQNGVWSASFHYNTDNIHVHISTVEPVPMRPKKRYEQYEVVQVDGKWQYKKELNPETGKMERIPILDEKGNIVEKEEYVGRFRESSLKAAKSTIVRELVNDKELNIEINNLIRQRLVQSMKEYVLYDDEEFCSRFLALYEKLPENKGVCNYRNSAMSHLRMEIDDLTELYIKKYHEGDFERLQDKLRLQESRYQAAYGDSDDTYVQNKLDDLYYRMGNAILRQLKEYDKSVKQKEETILMPEPEPEALEPDWQEDARENEEQEKAPEPDWQEEILGDCDDVAELFFEPEELKGYYLNWKDGYSEARDLIYVDHNYADAMETLQQLSQNGNVLAIGELGNIYHFGRGVDSDEELAQSYYEEALKGFMACYKSNPRYCAYRIGKQHLYGQGTEKDAKKAASYLQEAADENHSYAMYLLGGLYLQGNGVERNVDIALNYYIDAAELNNPYAQYKLGQIYEKGEVTDKNAEKAYFYYADALHAFLKQDGKDDNMLYRIGTMYLNGRGTSVDYRSAEAFLHEAAELNHQLAIYQLGRLYLMAENPERNVEKGIEYLKQAAENENMYAMYQLGQIYEKGEIVQTDSDVSYAFYEKALQQYLKVEEKDETLYYRIGMMYLHGKGTSIDYEKAVEHLQAAANLDNALAMYQLGKLYLSDEGVAVDEEKALDYFINAADHGNAFAAFKAGTLYENGIGTKVSEEEAYHYYQKALHGFLQMEPKDEMLSYRIGMMYLHGKGTSIDYEKAVEHLRASADLDNTLAMYQLGTLAKQSGDINSAREWYAKSAAMGNEYAAAALYRLEKPQQRHRILPYRRTDNYQLREALAWLRRSLDDTLEYWLNKEDYEQLQKEITAEKESQFEV